LAPTEHPSQRQGIPTIRDPHFR